MSTRTHIEVSELRQYAAALRGKAEEIKEQTQKICREFGALAQSGAWNDSRTARFAPGFDEGTDKALKLAARCDDYAAWLEKVAEEVEENWGEKMDVS